MSENNNAEGGRMKSALEIALERTADIKAGEDPKALNEEQKQKVKEINKEFDAVIAKLEVEFSQRIRGMAEKYGEAEIRAHLESFQKELRGEKTRINSERQLKLREYLDSIGK